MSVQGITFDTGVLIALERRKKHAWDLLRRASLRQIPIVVPTPVVGEWWRGRTDVREAILAALHVEPLSDSIARLAGEALAEVNAGTIDAFVMASAALRGNVVYTSDIEDLDRLRSFFRGVRVFEI